MLGNDTRRRVTAVERRLDWLDEHGTRGVDGIRIQLTEQAGDIAAVQQSVKDLAASIQQTAASRVRTFAAYLLAILPVYVLLWLTYVGSLKG